MEILKAAASIAAGIPFWKGLTKKEQEAVLRHAQLRSYEAGSVIHSREQECMGLIKVMEGRVRTFMFSDEGREITLYQMTEGDLDVLSAACVMSQITFETQMVAETDCRIYVIPALILAELKKTNLQVRCFIYERLGERFSDTVTVMQDMLFTRIDHRIAGWLLRNEVKGRAAATHEQIAREINSSREVVSRVLKEMEADGLLALSRGSITIRDRHALKAL